jgi:hypothetical protein
MAVLRSLTTAAERVSCAGDTAPDRCVLGHRMFCALGEPRFRHAETGDIPVMAFLLGDREAALPLASLQAEFGIDPQSADGAMLALIGAALDFVVGLRIGDPLPAEVLSGKASWQPDPLHLDLATAKLRLQLAARLNGGSVTASGDSDPERLLQAENDPMVRQQIQQAFERAAGELGLAGGTVAAEMVANLAEEMAFIETLRDRLLGRVKMMVAKIAALARGSRADGVPMETLTQVRRLSAAALRQIGGRFETLDAQGGDVMAALRNFDSQMAFIRSNRDRSQRAWEPILEGWDGVRQEYPRGLLASTYQFLAPRFMSISEWTSYADEDQKRA